MSDPFDDRLRAKLGHATSSTERADAALAGMAPSLRRARRTAQVKTGLAGLAIVLAVSGGITAVVAGVREPEQSIVVAGPPPGSPSTMVDGTPLTDTAGSGNDEPESTEVGNTVSTTSSLNPSVPTTVIGDGSTTTAPAQSTSLAVSSSTGASTTAPPDSSTSTSNSDVTVVESDCGFIEVEVNGQSVALVASVASAGYEIDEKDDGPESIEVSFEGQGGHCEIKAEVRNGALWTDVETD